MQTISFFMLLAVLIGGPMQDTAHGNPEANVEALKSLLRAGRVTKVEMLRMPDNVMTRVAVTPQALRSSASYIIIFHSDIDGTFEPLLSGISLKIDEHTPDLRWGVIFYDAQDREVGSIFVDKSGQFGYLNGESVSFNGGLLDTNLAKRLRRITGNLR
jgi:hypothetical protein